MTYRIVDEDGDEVAELSPEQMTDIGRTIESARRNANQLELNARQDAIDQEERMHMQRDFHKRSQWRDSRWIFAVYFEALQGLALTAIAIHLYFF